MRHAVLLALLLTGCATDPPSMRQARLNYCLAQADRRIIESARLEPGDRFSYRYKDTGGSGPELERFRACMQWRDPAYPAVR